jgi:hypothetical protein
MIHGGEGRRWIMAESLATRASRGHRTLCPPIAEETYRRIVVEPAEFRRELDDRFRRMPELFPAKFADGSQLKDDRTSLKQEAPIRRIITRDGTSYSIRPSFLTPYTTARVEDVEGPLFLRKFGVPFWALARVSGDDPMYWCRLECGLGRFGVAGTTVRRAELPEHLPADERHQALDGEKLSIATTVGGGCARGAEPSPGAGTDDLKAAYSVFKGEARDIAPKYTPRAANTDGWKGAKAAWKALFGRVVIPQCFLHAHLKVRDRGKHLRERFAEVSRRVREAYRAPDRRCFGQRLRSLRNWAKGHLGGVVREKVLDLCGKRKRWSAAYRHPGGHRTGNMLDRLTRGMNRCFDQGRHLHGSRRACRLQCRAWAVLWNYRPWSPATVRKNQGWKCPAERLNRHRYHECWLQNLLSSASLGGYRCPQPQNL